MCDAGSSLLFKFRSGTHCLNENLGRHRGKVGGNVLCVGMNVRINVMFYESVQPYSDTRASFMKKPQTLLEDDYEDFKSLENVQKSSYVLGSELCESKFDGLFSLVKEYIVDVWKYENTNCKTVTQDLVCKSIFSLHMGKGMVSLVRMVSLIKIVRLVRVVKCF